MASLAQSEAAREPLGLIGHTLYLSGREKTTPTAKRATYITALGLRAEDPDILNDLGVLMGTNFKKHRQVGKPRSLPMAPPSIAFPPP